MQYFRFLKRNLRWLAGGFLLTLFSSFGQTFFIALSTGHIRQAFGLTSGEYGTIFMVATLASAVSLPFVGQIVDRYSVVRVATFTILMLALACLAIAMAQSVMVLIIALFALRLFGQGMMTHTAFTAMGRWYVENRGKAVSISSLGFNAGQAIFPVSFVALIALIGWRSSWMVAAIIMVVVALPSIASLMWVERVPHGTKLEEKHVKTRQWTRSEMLRDPLFWLTTIGVLAPPFISTAIFFHQDYLLALKGWSVELFAWSLVWMTFIAIITGLFAGIAVDRTSAISLLPVLIVPLGFGCFVLALVDSPIAMLLFMSLLGVSMGVVSAVFGSLWPEIYGIRHLGAIRSVVMAFMVLFSALGPGVIGWLIDFGVSFSVQLFAMGFYCMAASLALTWCSVHFKRRNAAWNPA